MTTIPPSYTTLGKGYSTHPRTTHARTDISAMQTAYTPVQTQLHTLNTRYQSTRACTGFESALIRKANQCKALQTINVRQSETVRSIVEQRKELKTRCVTLQAMTTQQSKTIQDITNKYKALKTQNTELQGKCDVQTVALRNSVHLNEAYKARYQSRDTAVVAPSDSQ